jgi:hypothetical protein
MAKIQLLPLQAIRDRLEKILYVERLAQEIVRADL